MAQAVPVAVVLVVLAVPVVPVAAGPVVPVAAVVVQAAQVVAVVVVAAAPVAQVAPAVAAQAVPVLAAQAASVPVVQVAQAVSRRPLSPPATYQSRAGPSRMAKTSAASIRVFPQFRARRGRGKPLPSRTGREHISLPRPGSLSGRRLWLPGRVTWLFEKPR